MPQPLQSSVKRFSPTPDSSTWRVFSRTTTKNELGSDQLTFCLILIVSTIIWDPCKNKIWDTAFLLKQAAHRKKCVNANKRMTSKKTRLVAEGWRRANYTFGESFRGSQTSGWGTLDWGSVKSEEIKVREKRKVGGGVEGGMRNTTAGRRHDSKSERHITSTCVSCRPPLL